MESLEKENIAPCDMKKPRLSLQLKKKKPNEKEKKAEDVKKEGYPLLSNEAIEDTKKQVVLRNTDKSTKWAIRLFQSWCQQRNE